MRKEVHYTIKNKIITNIEKEDDLIELFNQKLAAIIFNLQNEEKNYHSQ